MYCDKISKMSLNETLLINSDGIMNNCNEACIRLDSDTSVEAATNRVFVVGHKFVFFLFKEISSFGLKWNFSTSRAGRRIACNRAHRQELVKHQ